MKRIAASLLVVALVAPGAFAGVVDFAPATVSYDIGDAALAALPFEVNVTSMVFDPYETIDMTIGSDNVPMVVDDWTYSADSIAHFVIIPDVMEYLGEVELLETGEYPHGLTGMGGWDPTAALTSPFAFGTLTVDASGLPLGTYYLWVDSVRDDGASSVGSGIDTEPIDGMATIIITPEPATIALLGLGAVGLLRRRK